MFTTRHFPNEPLSPEKLDDYLSRGFFRMGQMIFTTRFLFFNYQLYTPIWTRLDLDRHTFSKSQRKIMRRVRSRLRVEYGPVAFSPERENLYQAYRKMRGRRGFVTLRQSLYDHKMDTVFNTWEVRIFDEDRLVAFSHFDLGKNSGESINGVFDPEYRHLSLGYATMLFEMEYMRDRGMRYYYPGYVVPDYPSFDYKRRIGALDAYYPERNTWEPLATVDEDNLPSRLMRRKLKRLHKRLPDTSSNAHVMLNPSFDMLIRDNNGEVMETLPYPVFLLLFPLTVILGLAYVVTYDPYQQVYQLASYNVIGNLGSAQKSNQTPADVFTKVLTLDEIILETRDEDLMLRELKSWGSANMF